MNQTTEATSLVQSIRAATGLLERGLTAGLPEPYTIAAATYTPNGARLSFSDGDSFDQVETWAAWAGVTCERRVTQLSDRRTKTEFIEAVVVVDGVRVELTSNREVSA